MFLGGGKNYSQAFMSEVCSELDLDNYAAGFVNFSTLFAYFRNLRKKKKEDSNPNTFSHLLGVNSHLNS